MTDTDKTKTRSQSIAETLRARILRGDYDAGERMQEVALAEDLGVSRTPVREALRSLAEDGLLEYAANRGYRVRGFTSRDIQIAFRARAAMEGLGCRLLAERGLSAAELEQLVAILARGDALLASGDYRRDDFSDWRRMNRDFHIALLRMADSSLLEKIARDAQTIPIVNQGAFHWYQDQDFHHSHYHHHMIVDALGAGDGERAERWMQEHIHQAYLVLQRHQAQA